MTDKEYEFDVAFSFTQQDETLAFQINDLIQDRFKTFIYSEQQKKLAGADGETKFNEVFSEQSRLVVILYRKDWGKTPWTRIEETAIRNRGHEEGYDFTTFVQLDKDAIMPKWLPKNRIYYNFDRWGIKGLAPVIEARIEEAGGQARPETIEDKANRFKRLRLAEKEREEFLRSQEAVATANAELKIIMTKLQQAKKDIEDPSTYLHLGTGGRANEMYEFGYNGYYLCFNLSSPFIYGYDGCLRVTLYEKKGHYGINYQEFVSKQTSYKFDRDLLKNNGWSDFETSKNFITTDALVDTWVEKFIDDIERRKKNSR